MGVCHIPPLRLGFHDWTEEVQMAYGQCRGGCVTVESERLLTGLLLCQPLFPIVCPHRNVSYSLLHRFST